MTPQSCALCSHLGITHDNLKGQGHDLILTHRGTALAGRCQVPNIAFHAARLTNSYTLEKGGDQQTKNLTYEFSGWHRRRPYEIDQDKKREDFEMKKIKSLILALGLMLSVGAVFASEGVHWGYSGEEGPEYWGTLSHDYAACSEGKEQSPIDIPETAPVHSADIAFNYQPTALNIVNNGHSIKVNYDAGSSITVEGKTYNLLQFHFHSLSENTLHGGYYDMEMHLVHQSADGEYAVVGVLLERGAENAAYAPVWGHMPAVVKEDPETVSGVSVSAEDLLPGEQTYYRFNGSFTTPPCTEGVKWFVMNNAVELSDAQVDAFRELYDHNYRPVQPFYDRTFNPTTEGPVPTTLPESGGLALPLEGLLAGLGALTTAAGLYLHRRKAA